MHPANERRRYIVTLYLIGWPHEHNYPWSLWKSMCSNNQGSCCMRFPFQEFHHLGFSASQESVCQSTRPSSCTSFNTLPPEQNCQSADIIFKLFCMYKFYFDSNIHESCSQWPNKQWLMTSLVDEATVYSNDGLFYWSIYASLGLAELTHWGQVTDICVSKLTIIGSDNGLSPDLRQAIIWTNSGILLIGPLGTNFSEILIEILTFSLKKMHLKVSSGKRRPFCLSLNVLKTVTLILVNLSPLTTRAMKLSLTSHGDQPDRPNLH